MAYVLIKDGVVVQKQPNAEEGFIEVSDDVACAQILVNGAFVTPPPEAKSIQDRILDLEALQTPRRIREAALTVEGRIWLENLEAQIVDLRQQLMQEE